MIQFMWFEVSTIYVYMFIYRYNNLSQIARWNSLRVWQAYSVFFICAQLFTLTSKKTKITAILSKSWKRIRMIHRKYVTYLWNLVSTDSRSRPRCLSEVMNEVPLHVRQGVPGFLARKPTDWQVWRNHMESSDVPIWWTRARIASFQYFRCLLYLQVVCNRYRSRSQHVGKLNIPLTELVTRLRWALAG